MMNTKIKIISSVTNDYGIGYGGDLLVKDREDMKLFKSYTQFCPVVMGRKTFDSLGNVCLKDRLNIVISSFSPFYFSADLIVCDMDYFLNNLKFDCYVWAIGGEGIFKEFLERGMVEEIVLSHFDLDVEADTFFPKDYLTNFSQIEEEKFTNFTKKVYGGSLCKKLNSL